jgi:hypothetical protein
MSKPEWTKPYFGVSHCGKHGDEKWSTVHIHTNGSVSVFLWSHDCGFTPKVMFCDTEQQAKMVGENWIKQGEEKC